MMRKRSLTKLIAFALSAGMILQPVTAYAEDFALEGDFEEIVLEEDEAATEEVELLEKRPISNLRIEDDILYYDSFMKSCRYRIEGLGDTFDTFDTSVDVRAVLEKNRMPSGTYYIKVTAVGYNGSGIYSEPSEIVYEFTAPEYGEEEPPIEGPKLIKEDAIRSDVAYTYKEGDQEKSLNFASLRLELKYTFITWELYGEDGWKHVVTRYFNTGKYRAIASVNVKDEYKSLYQLDSDFQLTVNGKVWELDNVLYNDNNEIKTMFFVSPDIWVVAAEQTNIEKVVATSDIEELVKADEPIKDPIFNITEGDEVVISGTWMRKVSENEWEPIEGFFIPGVYQYDAEVEVADEYKITHALDQNLTLEVDGNQWKRAYRIDGTSSYEYVSPEFTIDEKEPDDPDEPEDPEDISGGTWYTRWGVTYYETKDGQRVTGKQSIEGDTYLFDESGALQRNIFYSKDGVTNYFGSDGKMVKGWLERYIGTYYFDEDGAMQTGFVDIGEDTYYFNEHGHQMKSVWVNEESKTFYIKADGTMAKSESIRRWGKKYSFDAGGVLMP